MKFLVSAVFLVLLAYLGIKALFTGPLAFLLFAVLGYVGCMFIFLAISRIGE